MWLGRKGKEPGPDLLAAFVPLENTALHAAAARPRHGVEEDMAPGIGGRGRWNRSETALAQVLSS